MKNPYEIVKSQYLSEKAQTLLKLKDAKSNRSVARCERAKYIFLVEPGASKQAIAWAIQEIYKQRQIRVVKVNTITGQTKIKRRFRGHPGRTSRFKKAIVTLHAGDTIDNV